MNYEKKYKEALNWMKDVYPTLEGAAKEDAEHYFPELKESRDERIKEDIIWCFKHSGIKPDKPINPHVRTTMKDALAWIEKLCEKIPSWSEEDETKIKSIIALLKSPSLCAMDSNKGIVDENIKYLNSLKNKVQPQPKQERNEDTQQWIDAIIKDYEEWYKVNKDHRATIQIEIDILKSLKERYTWKPSDEQMTALDLAISEVWTKQDAERLMSLYKDLKKLKG